MNMKKIMFNIIALIACMLTFQSCSDTDYGWSGDGSDVVVSPISVNSVTYNSVTLSSAVDGNLANMVKKGFCYSTANTTPTIADSLSEVNNGFTSVIADLTPNTSYYVRAFAYVADRVIYSDVTTFATTNKSLADELADYVAPKYADDYASISGWDNRANWNLANVHDPSVMKAADGYYYMYQTDASYGNAHDGHGHFHARRSKNLVDWEYLGATMNDSPTWVKDSLNSIRGRQGLSAIESPSYGYWAPCVRKVSDNLYRMYYCVVVDNYIKTGALNTTANFDNSWTERAFIGMMETSNPASNEWEDKGYVICSSSDKGTNWARTSTGDWNAYFKFNAIDPSYIITPQGEHWLIYGSWHSGIAAVQIDGTTGKTLAALPESYGTTAGIAAYGTRVNTRKMSSRWQGSEAPEVIYHDGYYYMFLAYDELSVAYNTRVVRSKNINGPYLGMNGTDVTNTGGEAYPIVTHPYKFSDNGYGWVGISHCAVFDDGSGNWYFSSQGRFPANVGGNQYSNALMMGQLRSIRWTESGWPVVMPERYGAVPQAEISESELVGNWQHIDLGYSAGNQKISATMTLAADHTITVGAWKGGTWSYDATNRVLTANGVKLYVQRECDWESFPRKATIVYAGYNNDGTKTYWGKKQ